MAKIIDRTGKGAAISQSENDSNLESLHGVNQGIAAASHTVDIIDQGDTLEFTSGGAVAVTLDSIATIVGLAHTEDFKVTLVSVGTGTIVTITPDALDAINTGVSTIVLTENEYITIQTDSTSAIWNIIGSSDALNLGGLSSSQFLRSDANDTATGDLTLTGANTHSGANTFSANVGLDGGWDINGTAVTATAAELNDLAGNAVDAADFTKLSQITATSAEINDLAGNAVDAADFTKLSQITATSAEINDLAGNAVDAADFTKLSQITATSTEINDLSGNAVDAADFTKLSQVTATSTELNLTDGLTATTAELNKIDGGTSATSLTAISTDRVVFNNGGSMVQVALTTLSAYFRSVSETLSNKILASPKFTGGQLATFNVSSTGTISNAPSGWSISKGATGIYTLTHNLGLTTGRLILHVFDHSSSGRYIVCTKSTETTNAVTYIIRDVPTATTVNSDHAILFSRGDVGE